MVKAQASKAGEPSLSFRGDALRVKESGPMGSPCPVPAGVQNGSMVCLLARDRMQTVTLSRWGGRACVGMDVPSGVSKDFLDHARTHQRFAVWAFLALIVVAFVGGVVAELVSAERWGAFFVVYVVALFAGAVAGSLLGWQEVQSWAKSLRDGWQTWMRAAVGAGGMAETAKRAGAWRVRWGWAWVSVLVALNAACLIAAWFALPAFALTPYGVFVFVTVALSGCTIGATGGLVVLEAWWCREVEGQTLALVEEGRVGVWGYR